ncbi:MAG: glycosyltransferase family 39 protein [Candidatus Zixiibacteriota bacterium]|nr:MAG: glycosyltransferase family 39 protein [candidate division Zixibacteria bacterium]
MKAVRRKEHLVYLLTLLVLAGGALLWSRDLDTDPPMHFSGTGQSLSTDPGQYVYHARNKVLFGEADPFDYPRWMVYRRSLTSAVASVWFSLVGVSSERARLVGLLMSLTGLIFFLLAVARLHRPWVTLAVALCYVLCVSLFVYGRLSYLENGLILYTGLLFFVFAYWSERFWGWIACGVLVAMATLTGKLFGALLMPAVVLALYFTAERRRWTAAAAGIAAYVIAAVLLIFALYGTDFAAVYSYFGEQTYGLRGMPEGLTSPWSFIEHLISYGFGNRLFFLDLDLLVFLLWGGFLLTLVLAGKDKLRGLSPVTVLSIFVIACIILGLMPLNYSPLRYALFLIPAIIVFCFTITDQLLKGDRGVPTRAGYLVFVPLFLILWNALFQLIGIIFFMNNIPTRELTWATLPAALAIIYAVRWLIGKGRIPVTRRVLTAGIAVIVVFSVGLNVYRMEKRVWFHRTHNLAEAGDDIRKILGDGAVVSGPYAPALTLNNNLMTFIHLFGVAEVDSTLLDRIPVTHLAVDESNWAEAESNYPQLQGLLPVTVYWIRDYAVRIYNISKVFDNPQANSYRETAYERAADYYNRKVYDSATALIDAAVREQPDARSTRLLLAELLRGHRQYDQAVRLLVELAERYSTDYYTSLSCGRAIQMIALAKQDRGLLNLAEKYYAQAVKHNPFQAESARQMFIQTMRQAGAGSPPSGP